MDKLSTPTQGKECSTRDDIENRREAYRKAMAAGNEIKDALDKADEVCDPRIRKERLDKEYRLAELKKEEENIFTGFKNFIESIFISTAEAGTKEKDRIYDRKKEARKKMVILGIRG